MTVLEQRVEPGESLALGWRKRLLRAVELETERVGTVSAQRLTLGGDERLTG